MDFDNKVLNILGEILQKVTNLEERMTALEERVAALEQEVAVLKQDVSLLKAKVFLMDEKLNNLEEKIDEQKEDYINLSRTVTKIEYDSEIKFQTLFDYIEVNRAEHQRLEDLINSKISEDRIFFKTILDKTA